MTGKEYISLYEGENIKPLIQFFWKVTTLDKKKFRTILCNVSDAEAEDDFEEFLRSGMLLKAGLSSLGFSSPQECQELYHANESNLANVLETLAQLVKTGTIAGSDLPGGQETVPYVYAQAAVLLLRSSTKLDDWSRKFLRVLASHPDSLDTIFSVVQNAMQGSFEVVHDFDVSHRSFYEAGKLFMETIENEYDDISLPWQNKWHRLLFAMGGNK